MGEIKPKKFTSQDVVSICALVEDRILSIPQNISIEASLGYTTVQNEDTRKTFRGRKLILKGTLVNLKYWIRPLGKIWLEQGNIDELKWNKFVVIDKIQ